MKALYLFLFLLVPLQAGSQWTYTNATTIQTNPITLVSSWFVVPDSPTVSGKGAFEFHTELYNGKIEVQTSLSYDCTITRTLGCSAPYTNGRYYFYESVMNLSIKCGGEACRTHFPYPAYPVTEGSNYTLTLQQVGSCWKTTLANSTASLSFTVCKTQYVNLARQTFKVLGAGDIEEHNITSCLQLPAQGSFTESFSQTYSWTPHILIDNCNYTFSFPQSQVVVGWA